MRSRLALIISVALVLGALAYARWRLNALPPRVPPVMRRSPPVIGSDPESRLRALLQRPAHTQDEIRWAAAQLGHADLAVRVGAAGALAALVGAPELPGLLLPLTGPPAALPGGAYLLGIAVSEARVTGVFAQHSRERAARDERVPEGARALWRALDRLEELARADQAPDARLAALGALLGGDVDPWEQIRAAGEAAGAEGRIFFLEAMARAGRCQGPGDSWAGEALSSREPALRLAGLHAIERCRLRQHRERVEALSRGGADEEERRSAADALRRLRE